MEGPLLSNCTYQNVPNRVGRGGSFQYNTTGFDSSARMDSILRTAH